MDKEKYLHDKVKPFDPSKVNTVEDALVALQSCSFQGRNLGRALEVLTNMVQKPECFRVLTLSGAMVPAGMEEIVCQGIEKGIFSAIVTTGANIIHSIVNSFADDHQAHYIGGTHVNDAELFNRKINRIYDTFLPESLYENAESALYTILSKIFNSGTEHKTTTSQILKLLGPSLSKRNFIRVAAEQGVPIFCGAISDSEFSLNLAKYRMKHNLNIILDEIADVWNFAELIKKHPIHGIIILGGGVPRNWAQQIFPLLEQMDESDTPKFHGYAYSVRFHTAVPQDGGLSGCTISESISWGKYSADAKNQSVWGDSTISFPLIMTALFQRLEKI